MFQNDISVTDHTLQVILRGRSETDRSGHTRISVIDEPHSIGLEYTERIKNVCHLERNITVPYISSMENSSIRSYCYNLYPQGHFTGCVSITELLHPFRDSDFVLADFYFSYFHKAFEKYLQSFHAAEQISVTVIRKLLDKLPMTAEEKKAIALKKDEKYICFKLQERIETHFMPMDYMHALLCTFFPDQIFTVIRHEQIIGFMKISSSVSSPDPLFIFQIDFQCIQILRMFFPVVFHYPFQGTVCKRFDRHVGDALRKHIRQNIVFKIPKSICIFISWKMMDNIFSLHEKIMDH